MALKKRLMKLKGKKQQSVAPELNLQPCTSDFVAFEPKPRQLPEMSAALESKPSQVPQKIKPKKNKSVAPVLILGPSVSADARECSNFHSLPRPRVKSKVSVDPELSADARECPDFHSLPRRRVKSEVSVDPEWWQRAYSEALKKHGSVSVNMTQCIITGPSAVGKSSLRHLLVHDTPIEVNTSTGVLELPDVVYIPSEQCATEGGSLAWLLADSDTMGHFLHDCIAHQAYDHDEGQHLCEIEDKETEVERHKINEAVESLERELSCFMAKMKKEYRRKRHPSGMLQDASFIHFYDTGGQPSFQDTLPLLLSASCTYIQVFNAAQDLDQPVQSTYRFDDSPTIVLPSSMETGWQGIVRSLSSMQTLAHKFPKGLAGVLDGQLPELRIFLVGTFKDQIEEEQQHKVTQNINQRLQSLNGQLYFRNIENDSAGNLFYLISNIAGKEEQRGSVSSLRRCLSNARSSLKIKVPVRWYFFQQITKSAQQKFFKYEDLKAFCLKHRFIDEDDADEQFRSLLHLFTLLGFYSFFDLKGANYVCTDSELFLTGISKLLAVQFIPPANKEMRSFKNTGILSSNSTLPLLQQLHITQIDPNWFLRALEYLGIAAKMPFKDQMQYFIPAALPQSSGFQKPSASFAPLCLTYKIQEGAETFYNHLPRGIYCRLAVELIRQGWEIITKRNTRNLLMFRRQEYQFFIQENVGHITLIPQVQAEMHVSDLHAGCKMLLNTIKECLSHSAMAVLGSHFSTEAQLCVGFECLCQVEGISHLAVRNESEGILVCTETHMGQKATIGQCVWFSKVGTAKLIFQHDLGISTLEDSACRSGPDQLKPVTNPPMSLWNDCALVSQEYNLVTKVEVSSQLRYMLEKPAGGFMSRAEALSVMNQTGENGKMAEVVRILRGKGDKEFEIFCEMLQRSNYGVWANRLRVEAAYFQMHPQLL